MDMEYILKASELRNITFGKGRCVLIGVVIVVVYLTTLFQHLRLYSVDF
jgi:hypothetical protein